MEDKINKEIRNYTESMFCGLSLRQFIFSVLACGVAVGLYILHWNVSLKKLHGNYRERWYNKGIE
ncbi:PrgI family protein [Clostridium sp. C105KSO13]|nr:PrgI family protein [Clostridium sp. C105KSO13]